MFFQFIFSQNYTYFHLTSYPTIFPKLLGNNFPPAIYAIYISPFLNYMKLYGWVLWKLCKIQFFFNIELENFKYFRFYTTFQLDILGGTLNLHTFSTFTHVMLQKWLKLYAIIDLNAPLLKGMNFFEMSFNS